MSIRIPVALVASAVAALGLAACQQPATSASAPAADTAKIEQALKDGEAQWNDEFKAKDIAKIAAHYASDAVLMAPGAPPTSGVEAVSADLKAMTSDPAFALTFSPDKVSVATSGDMAYTRGHFSLTATDPASKAPATQGGSYVTVYKKQADGSWKAVEDILTPGAAAPPPAAKAE